MSAQINQQLSTVNGQPGISVGHEELRVWVKTSDISTKPGGSPVSQRDRRQHPCRVHLIVRHRFSIGRSKPAPVWFRGGFRLIGVSRCRGGRWSTAVGVRLIYAGWVPQDDGSAQTVAAL